MADRAALYAPLRTGLDTFTREAGALCNGDVGALHRTRVASRRLRELVPLLWLERRIARSIPARLRKVPERLGAVRVLDVRTRMIHVLGRDPRHSPKAWGHVRDAVENAQRAARDRLATKLPLAKMQRVSRRLERVA